MKIKCYKYCICYCKCSFSNTNMHTKAKHLTILKHVHKTLDSRSSFIFNHSGQRGSMYEILVGMALSYESSKFQVNIRREQLNRKDSNQNLVGCEAQFKQTFGTIGRTCSSYIRDTFVKLVPLLLSYRPKIRAGRI
jgi:hypothetical protein